MFLQYIYTQSSDVIIITTNVLCAVVSGLCTDNCPNDHEVSSCRPSSFLYALSCSANDPQWGTVDAEMKVPSVENPELINVFPLKPGVGQKIAMYALLTARNFFHVLISTSHVHSPSFFSLKIFSLTF